MMFIQSQSCLLKSNKAESYQVRSHWKKISYVVWNGQSAAVLSAVQYPNTDHSTNQSTEQGKQTIMNKGQLLYNWQYSERNGKGELQEVDPKL
jgi:hypothetical protein